MKRSELRRTTGLRATSSLSRGKRLNQRSEKMKKVYEERRPFVAKLLKERPYCEAALDGCWVKSTEVHETLARSATGAIIPGDKADVQGQVFRALCHMCHRFITDHPKWAKENGWARSRYEG